MAVFPGAIPPVGSAVANNTLAVAGHTALHNTSYDEIRALATKLGTGSSTASNNTVLRGNGSGTSAWAQVNLATDVTGTLPIQNGGTGVTTNSDLRQLVLPYVYPVGSIYFNATDATNPGTLLGFGTWVAWAAGRVPVGFDSTQTEFDSAEEMGGEKTHVLTTTEIPAHTHSYADTRNGVAYSGGANASIDPTVGTAGSTTGSTGGGSGHNNLQPYITVYAWKRTA